MGVLKRKVEYYKLLDYLEYLKSKNIIYKKYSIDKNFIIDLLNKIFNNEIDIIINKDIIEDTAYIDNKEIYHLLNIPDDIIVDVWDFRFISGRPLFKIKENSFRVNILLCDSSSLYFKELENNKIPQNSRLDEELLNFRYVFDNYKLIIIEKELLYLNGISGNEIICPISDFTSRVVFRDYNCKIPRIHYEYYNIPLINELLNGDYTKQKLAINLLKHYDDQYN
jgi:hypothetical protein